MDEIERIRPGVDAVWEVLQSPIADPVLGVSVTCLTDAILPPRWFFFF